MEHLFCQRVALMVLKIFINLVFPRKLSIFTDFVRISRKVVKPQNLYQFLRIFLSLTKWLSKQFLYYSSIWHRNSIILYYSRTNCGESFCLYHYISPANNLILHYDSILLLWVHFAFALRLLIILHSTMNFWKWVMFFKQFGLLKPKFLIKHNKLIIFLRYKI